MRSKVQEVRKIAEQELGFVTVDNEERDTWTSSKPYNHFMYIVRERIVGLLVTEKIAEAYIMASPSTTTTTTTTAGPGSESPTMTCKANLGVHLMWVHNKHRGEGIATKLLDVARERAVFGYTSVPTNRVAFSSPTEAGLEFAQSYMDKHNNNSKKAPVLVYRYVKDTSK